MRFIRGFYLIFIILFPFAFRSSPFSNFKNKEILAQILLAQILYL